MVLELTTCPRCFSRGIKDDYDYFGRYRLCLTCGWHDAVGVDESRTPSPVFLMVRYSGEESRLSDMVVKVEIGITDKRGASFLMPLCPWCNEKMKRASLAGSRKYQEESRYVCEWGHRISLFNTEYEITWD